MSPEAFLHLGSRAAVDQAFSSLTKEGKLLRVGRGIHVTPLSSRFATRAPAPEKVVRSLAVQRGEVVTPRGANAAIALGLTQQVPIREVCLTSGAQRQAQPEPLRGDRQARPSLTAGRAGRPFWMARAIGEEAPRG